MEIRSKKPLISIGQGGRKILTFVLLIILFVCLVLLILQIQNLPANDFIEYWSAAKAITNGGNPYDPGTLLIYQHLTGSAKTMPLMMYNPFWTLTLVLPFALLTWQVGQILWLILQISIVLLCAILSWRLYDGQPRQPWLGLIMVFLFAPTILVLEMGQITPLVLLGVLGFQYFAFHRRNDWLAGFSLALLSIKPQLVILFGCALIFWVIQQRRWLILGSSLLAISFLTGILLLFNPGIIQQYIFFITSGGLPPYNTPTLAGILRILFPGVNQIWVQFIPLCIGFLWLLYYGYQHHNSWNWETSTPMILLMSILVSPFAWTYDCVLLLPAILHAAKWLTRSQKQGSAMVLAGIFIIFNILDLVLHIKISDFWFFWFVPVLFVWYFLVVRHYSFSQVRRLIPDTD